VVRDRADRDPGPNRDRSGTPERRGLIGIRTAPRGWAHAA
jgi:hypothetical protein